MMFPLFFLSLFLLSSFLIFSFIPIPLLSRWRVVARGVESRSELHKVLAWL